MIIETRALGAGYGRVAALQDVSLEVPEGSVYALLGRNGAGKSTLVRTLLGQHRAASGSARVLGRDPWRERPALMAESGVVPETPDAPPGMSARELLEFSRRLYARCDVAAALARLERFGVPADRAFSRLSKGQRGQLSLALALAHQPRLLVLDDPTLGFDPIARRAFFDELIAELADRGTTVFVTTHDLDGVERIADRVGMLRDGRLVRQQDMETLKADFRSARSAGAETPLTLEEVFVDLQAERREVAQ